ncbi:MAG: hypothetical protein ABW021_07585 [Acidimicrobiia bacterium]
MVGVLGIAAEFDLDPFHPPGEMHGLGLRSSVTGVAVAVPTSVHIPATDALLEGTWSESRFGQD